MTSILSISVKKLKRTDGVIVLHGYDIHVNHYHYKVKSTAQNDILPFFF